MRISAVAFLMILTTVFLSACAQDSSRAQVADRGANYYGRAAVQHAAVMQASTMQVASVAPASAPATIIYAPAAPVASAPAVASVAPVLPVEVSPVPAVSQAAVIPAPAVATPAAPEQVQSQTAMTTLHGGAWQWPVQGKVIQQFGSQQDGTVSEGITIAAVEGAPIRAAQSGEVAFVGHNIRDYGNMVILRHADGTLTSYSHARDITVKKGEQIAIGSVIGTVGSSGSAASPQLHFALREEGRAVDPLAKLPQNVASNLI